MTAPTVPTSRRARRRRPRSRATFTSVLGELLLTAGVVVLLFVAWQMWIGDIIIAAEKNEEGSALTSEWADMPAPELPPLIGEGEEKIWEPPILDHPAEGEKFATMLIPRFGEDYNFPVAGGTSRAITLDPIGIGVYDQSKMPGEVGNFSVAGHRTTWGKPFNQIDRLQLNDPIVVETPEGWYTYRFRTLEYVTPTEVDVLRDVPQMPEAQTGERYITLTACSPLYSLAERIVAYGVWDGFQPRAEGPPASLTEGVS
ncbi:MAG: class E sortase [Actinomycetota bacterium]